MSWHVGSNLNFYCLIHWGRHSFCRLSLLIPREQQVSLHILCDFWAPGIEFCPSCLQNWASNSRNGFTPLDLRGLLTSSIHWEAHVQITSPAWSSQWRSEKYASNQCFAAQGAPSADFKIAGRRADPSPFFALQHPCLRPLSPWTLAAAYFYWSSTAAWILPSLN